MCDTILAKEREWRAANGAVIGIEAHNPPNEPEHPQRVASTPRKTLTEKQQAQVDTLFETFAEGGESFSATQFRRCFGGWDPQLASKIKFEIIDRNNNGLVEREGWKEAMEKVFV